MRIHLRLRQTSVAALLASACVAALGVIHLSAQSAQAPDRSKPPALGPAPALSLPQLQKRQLTNGLAVWIVELHEVPVAQVNFVVRGGTADDPAGKYGVASLTAAMLAEGAGTKSSLEIADAIDFLGADLGSTSGFDSMAVRLHVPVARLADALPIMADVALRPTFPKDELERLRQQRLTTILQSKDDAGTVASLAFSRVLFQTGRFGTAAMGTEATIKGFTPEDLRAFYNGHFSPQMSTLIVVGDVKPDQVVPLLERNFGSWKKVTNGVVGGITGSRNGGTSGPPRARREVYLVDKPGAPQSQIRIGIEGVERSTPDYFSILVMNTILGGSFSSRLNLNLREEHGYTYGASSNFDMRLRAGPFTAAAGVQTDKTAESLQEFFKELDGIQKTVPADELTRAKNYVALRFPGGFETTGDISRRLEDALIYNLPDGYFQNYVRNVEAVTAGDVQGVAKAYVPTDKVAVVIVGDLKVIEPKVRALNLGPVTTLALDDIFSAPR